jgi:hypothetical protein
VGQFNDHFHEEVSPNSAAEISRNPLIRRAVIKPSSFHIDQRDHVGGVFGHDLEQLLLVLRVAVDPIDPEPLVDHQRYHDTDGNPEPLHAALS